MISSEAKALAEEKRHDFSSLIRIMALLRSENGCPWDRAQTHHSIRANLIEETYEVVEAIDREDPALMREELGDALLQVIFHARIAEEDGEFSIDDVIHDVCAKLIHRHPTIFVGGESGSAEQMLDTWEKIKTEEKQRVGLAGSLAAVPPALPALMRAQKCIKKAAKAGVARDSSACAADVMAAAEQLTAQTAAGEAAKAADTLGQLLFSLCALAQREGLDAEEALSHRTDRFVAELTEAEKLSGGDAAHLSELAGRAFS